MSKRIIQRFMPDPHKIRHHKHLQIFGELLHEPNLWHLNRKSVSGAFAIGLFAAFVPIPFQMVLAAAAAIPLRVNLPISVGLVWVSNPVTIPPIFYFCYLVGTWILGAPPQEAVAFALSIDWLQYELIKIWQPFLLGCLVVGTTCSVSGYASIRLLWRWHVITKWQDKRQRRKQVRR